MKRILVFGLMIILIACEKDFLVSPTPVPSGIPDVEEPAPPLYPRIDHPFSWELARGFTLFAGARASETQIREIFSAFRAKWPNLLLTARVCAEVQSWPDTLYLPRGAEARPNFDKTSAAYNELKHFLDVAATIHGTQVLVVAICNLKEDGTSWENMRKWTQNVCHLTSQYANTAVEVVNEARHPNSSLKRGESRVNELMSECHNASERYMEVGSDSKAPYRYDQGIATFLSYHPQRNPDPTKVELRNIVRERIGATVFSETTSLDIERYSPDYRGATTSIRQIEDYARHAEKAGGVFVYHTTWLLGWPELPIGYILNRGDWPIRHGR